MAEVKNPFIKSKMNLDLDARLVPRGEYRQGFNIQVSKSEGPDVGALENVLGNENLQNFKALNPGINNLEIIGYVLDPSNNTAYFFLTNNTDTGFPTEINYNSSAANFIYSYNVLTSQSVKLVNGQFLNFSTTNPIYGINIVENLLFWTDNRNQPRKINISKAAGYYTSEDHISVAKFAPYEAINLYQQSSVPTANNAYECTMQDVISPNLPDGVTENLYRDTTYPGDPDFLENKFVRFSYRFKFDDNEYSTLAPFTQECFIPKQDGYFLQGDQESTYRSTIVGFMENKINRITLNIPLPKDLNNNLITGSTLFSALKVTEIDILYKESDSQAVQVVDTILLDTFSADTDNIINYVYQGIKPYKTLPEADLIRVYDKTPVRAFSQEVSGNRVIYGNFQDKHTPPTRLNYKAGAFDKSAFQINSNNPAENNTSLIEYPNSTLKQNRNYQVGVVLSDRYGRSSTTILSSVPESTSVEGGNTFANSTYYNPYRLETDTPVGDWPGDALKILFNGPIESNKTLVPGTPGIFIGADTQSDYNPLGWYSYKIVVKQFEQEYYNVYLPSVLNAYPGGVSPDGDDANNTAFTVLINDNINKVPRDLSEIGPEQKQYRSSVQLFGRVTPDAAGPPTYNLQFFPENLSSTVNTIAEQDFILGTSGTVYEDIYQTKSNPYLARITQPINSSGTFMGSSFFTTNPTNYQLAVYETDPDTSRLDIYYETSTSGLITDLNTAINTNTNNVEELYNDNVQNFDESKATGSIITTDWAPVTTNSLGDPFNGDSTAVITSVFTSLESFEPVSNYFTIESLPANGSTYNPNVPETYKRYRIKTAKEYYFGPNASINKKYFVDVSITPAGAESSIVQFVLPLQNIAPTITQIELVNGTIITPLTNPYTLQKASGNTGTLATLYGENGSINSTDKVLDLTWSIVSPVNQTLFEITSVVDTNKAILSTQQDLSGPYLITIRLTDAGGLTYDTSINVIFGETSINPEFGQKRGISLSGQGGESGAMYFVNNLTNAAGATPLPAAAGSNDIRAPFSELELSADVPSTSESKEINTITGCSGFRMSNKNVNSFQYASQSLSQTNGGLSQGTAFVAVTVNFNQLPFNFGGTTANDYPLVMYPIYLQYRNRTGAGYPNNWVTATDIEEKEIKFGGSQINRDGFPATNDVGGKGVINDATIAKYFQSSKVNESSFPTSIVAADCLEANTKGKTSEFVSPQSSIARKVFAIGKQQGAVINTTTKYGDYRLIVRYPWGIESSTGSNTDPIVVGYGTNNCPNSAFSSYLGAITASVDFGDFYYPEPYGGSNLYSYEYRVSPTGANTSDLADSLTPNNSVFAREWHLKYITKFYLDADLTQEWLPQINGNGVGWYCYSTNDASDLNSKYGTDFSNTAASGSAPVAPWITSRKWVAYFNSSGVKDTTSGSIPNTYQGN